MFDILDPVRCIIIKKMVCKYIIFCPILINSTFFSMTKRVFFLDYNMGEQRYSPKHVGLFQLTVIYKYQNSFNAAEKWGHYHLNEKGEGWKEKQFKIQHRLIVQSFGNCDGKDTHLRNYGFKLKNKLMLVRDTPTDCPHSLEYFSQYDY